MTDYGADMTGGMWGRLMNCEAYRGLPLLAQRLVLVAAAAFSLTLITGVIYLIFDAPRGVGIFASLAAGLATGLGAAPVFFFREISQKTLGLMLGAAAGVMLAATSFSLLQPGIEAASVLWSSSGIYLIALSVLAGAGFLVLADRFFPYHHFIAQGDEFASKRRVWLFIAAVALHNLPEGWAIGVSYGAGDFGNGLSLAIAISLQNLPEGLAVALPMLAAGYSARWSVGIATLTGLIEPCGGLMGLFLAQIFPPLMPIGMALAAGAMLFVINDDIVPALQSQGKERSATLSLLLGFVIMMILDQLTSS